MEDLKKLLAAATPGPWEVSERTKDWRPQVVSTEHGPICTMHIPEVGDADSNAALIVAAVNALPELVERVKRYEAALKKIDAGHLPDLEGKPNVLDYAIATRVFYMKLARAALNQEPGQ